jgi:hypothetical protein
MEYIDSFSLVTIDSGTIHFNNQFGVSIQGFYGFVTIKNSNILDNYGCGLVAKLWQTNHLDATDLLTFRPFRLQKQLILYRCNITNNQKDGLNI